MTSGTTHRIPGTLPPQATGFVGRQAEIAQVSAALMESRLVTIVGTGGVGKTRVAVRVAAQTTGRYPDGVHPGRAVGRARSPAARVHRGGQPGPARRGRPASARRPSSTTCASGRCCSSWIPASTSSTRAPRWRARCCCGGARRSPCSRPAGSRCDVRAESTFLLRPLPGARRRRRGVGLRCGRALRPARRGCRRRVHDHQPEPRRRDRDLPGARRHPAGDRARHGAAAGAAARPDGPAASTTVFTCSPGASGPGRRGTRRSGPRSNGATTSARRSSRWSGPGCRCSRATFDLAAAATVCADDELTGAQVVESLIALAEKSVLVIEPRPNPGPRPREPGGPRGPGSPGTGCSTPSANSAPSGWPSIGRVAAVRRRLVAHYLALAQRWGDDPMRDQLRAVPRAQP